MEKLFKFFGFYLHAGSTPTASLGKVGGCVRSSLARPFCLGGHKCKNQRAPHAIVCVFWVYFHNKLHKLVPLVSFPTRELHDAKNRSGLAGNRLRLPSRITPLVII